MATPVQGPWRTVRVVHRLWCIAEVHQMRRRGWTGDGRTVWTHTETRRVWRVCL
jgi:hypothetical protein